MRTTDISSIKRRAVRGLAVIIFSAALTEILVSAPGAAQIAQPGPPWGSSSIASPAAVLA
jgi:hypothetical protein